MKRSTKITSAIISFFLIITIVIVGRTMIGNHFAKKFSKRPPPGIIVKEVSYKDFSEKIESYGTAVSKRTESFRIKKDDLTGELTLKDNVKKGDLIVQLKDRNIVAPFDGVLGYRGITGDILGSDNSIIITLDDNSILYSDIKIPETFASFIKKDLPVKAKFSGMKNKVYDGKIYAVSSRINAETRSLLTRVIIQNENSELIPGSLLEINVNYNERNSLGIPDTSMMVEGSKYFVYKVSEDNIANKIEIEIGIRNNGFIEIVSGLDEGEIIVAEGLKKVRPKGEIKPIKK
ncbi:MAG: efflux RND transporter periplasmic adaptor subunit [Candidatus Pelagibacter bacterium]|jgi:membrane fusion protein (multidrug efflux system)|nr:efflux RND transporter periplasmic adaptor subunit [Candidatus Pelagibacter bacterium]MDA8533052.1 efflux RND transporter periplasmic adaptor subunit [Candidatus Pelagibacter bacterium]MDB9744863.1 efflux RND transporter periplasmic adaptor subunit [Candidatus Pelagibacter sp.]MDC1248472.1 efflux RND transporter periplasmic adaptor subunit [Pelagibacteraceae bacterium]MDF1857466.1 efflux RND transporter periplasmic adaptor subunit [Candidatus Pelagibacter bacterium]|tara:strand:+ start:1247 stop:2116 length:870 start_codon:yes stop_codon:yes gene_type:complete